MTMLRRSARTFAVSIAFVGAVCVVEPARAAAAAAYPIVKDIQDKCAAAPKAPKQWGGAISAADLYTALMKEHPLAVQWNDTYNTRLFQAIAQRVTAPPVGKGGTDPGLSNEQTWANDLAGWFNTRSPDLGPAIPEHAVEVLGADGQPLTATSADLVLQVLSGHQSAAAVVFACRYSAPPTPPTPPTPPGPGPKPPAKGPSGSLVIADTSADLGPNGPTKKAGQLSYVDDFAKKSLSAATQIAVGYALPLSNLIPKDDTVSWGASDRHLTFFLYYDRQGANQPTQSGYTNILSPGVQTSGFLNPPRNSAV